MSAAVGHELVWFVSAEKEIVFGIGVGLLFVHADGQQIKGGRGLSFGVLCIGRHLRPLLCFVGCVDGLGKASGRSVVVLVGGGGDVFGCGGMAVFVWGCCLNDAIGGTIEHRRLA